MKMIMAIIPRDQGESVLQALVAANHTATYVETRGGMLRQAQLTLFIAVQDEELEVVLDIIQGSCTSPPLLESDDAEAVSTPMPARPTLGGAVCFIWNIERTETC
ncbi:MAG: cyclic-di-AMP receptor [Anaerolineae bacterium]|jgi:uncharacterized protein YaaQ